MIDHLMRGKRSRQAEYDADGFATLGPDGGQYPV